MTELEKAHARIAALEADLESIGAGGVSGPLVRTPTSGAADLPEALRLANVLDLAKGIDYYNEFQRALNDAAAELRRLHAYCQELEAQVIRDCMTHVQNPAENEHVADDMSKNGAEMIMSTQPVAQQGAAYAALPEPLEIDWPDLNAHALGCGVEDRGLHSRYECAEYGWQDGVDKCAERVPEQIFDADQMRAFADATHAIRASHGQAPAQPDFTTLGAAIRAIRQAIELIGEPVDDRMRTVRRVLRGAVIVSEDSEDIPAQPHHVEAMERAWLWMENQADGQSKGGHATFDLMMLREERDALRTAIDATPLPQAAQPAPAGASAEPYGWLYDWTHSSATSRADTTYTGFTKDEAHARKHDNCLAIFAAPQPAPPADSVLEDAVHQVFMDRGWHDVPASDLWMYPTAERWQVRTLYFTPQPTQAQAGAVPLTCEWTHNEDDGFWETACGEAWRFEDGGPAENSMKFCHSCGNSLRIKGGQHGTE